MPYTTAEFDVSLLTPPAAVPPAIRGDSMPNLSVNELNEAAISKARHRDGWVLFNALTLRSGVDPEGDEAERLTLGAQIAYLNTYSHNGAIYYSVIFYGNIDRTQAPRHGMSPATYQNEFDALTSQGFGLKLVTGVGSGTAHVYAAVWQQ